jgi:hypothetical protein
MCQTKSAIVACQKCGAAVVQSGGAGRPKKWCSSQCRMSASHAKKARTVQCRRCQGMFVTTTGKGRLCHECHHKRERNGADVACKTCGKAFYCTPSGDQAYCSRPCLWQARKAWHQCKQCKVMFSRRKYRTEDRREYCCIQCYWDANGMTGEAAAKLKGNWYGNARRRCRRFGVTFDSSVTLKRVADRDHNVCQLCRAKCNEAWIVNKRTRRPHPRNRSIDHIVPLSAGLHGHEWSNVQLACMRCNVNKSDTRTSCQRRLF